MINALGLLEVDGMVAAVEAADAMLKMANVRLLSHEILDPGRLTLVIEGDLAACRAALDAGCVAAQRSGRVISRKEIGRPEGDTQWLIEGFTRQPKKPEDKPKIPKISVSSVSESVEIVSQVEMVDVAKSEALLTLLASVRQGMTVGEVAAHFGWSLDDARDTLEQLFSGGVLRKRSSRYRLKN